MEVRTGLSYADVLLVPQRSRVGSRSDVDLATYLTDELPLEIPVLSAPMDSVTEVDTALALSEAGGFGTIHRFMEIEDQAAQVRAVTKAGGTVGGAIGINEDYIARADALVSAGAACIMVDVAHGHLETCLAAVDRVSSEFDVPVVAGNVVTQEAVADLAGAGADGVKVGVGPGSHCTTREVAGSGVPQLTAVIDCATAARDHDVRVIADGGIRGSGDAVKALMAGADTVMLGRFFAGTTEAPGEVIEVDGRRYKRTRGMASAAANHDRADKDRPATVEEGVEALTPYTGALAAALEEFLAGIRSGLSYSGGHSIEAARANAEFIRTTQGAQSVEGAHSVLVPDTDTA